MIKLERNNCICLKKASNVENKIMYGKHSPCCKDEIYLIVIDDILVGKCCKCHDYIIRINPRTECIELLNGLRPNTDEELMRIE